MVVGKLGKKKGGMSFEMKNEKDGRHHGPHVHVKYAEFEASIDFDGKVFAGYLPPKKLRKACRLIVRNRQKLDEAWKIAVEMDRFEFMFDEHDFELREKTVMYGLETEDEYGLRPTDNIEVIDGEEEAVDDWIHPSGKNIIAVRALPDYRVWARYNTGEEVVYDFKPDIAGAVNENKIFWPLRDQAFFETVYLNGGAVGWATGKGRVYMDEDMWFETNLSVCQYTMLEEGIPTPESALTPEELARPVITKDRDTEIMAEIDELDKFFEEHLSKEEYDKFCDEFCEKYKKVWDTRELLKAEKEKLLRAKAA